MRRPKLLEILQAVTLGALAGSLWGAAPLFQDAKPELLSAIALYMSIFLVPGATPIIGLVIFSMLVVPVLKEPEILDFARLCIFAPALMASRRLNPTSGPLICAVISWQIFLFLYFSHDPWLHEHLPPLTSPVLMSMIVEFVAIISLPVITSSSVVSFCMGRPSAGVPLRSFLIHSTFVPLVLIVGGGFLALRSATGHSVQNFFGDFTTVAPGIVIAALGILLLCLLLVSLIANLVNELIETLVTASDPNEERQPGSYDGKTFSDFAKHVSTVQCNVASLVRAKRIVEDIVRMSGAREDSIPMRWEELERAEKNAEMLHQAVRQFPGACLGVLASGKIVLATPGISNILPFNERQLLGETYSVLQDSDDAWSNDVFGALSWAMVENMRLLDSGARKMVSSLKDGQFLDMLVSAVLVEPERTPGNSLGADPRSGVMIVVLMRPTLDLRPIQLRLLHPNEFELAGTSAVELSSDLQKGLQDILNHVQLVSTKLNNLYDSQGQLFAESAAGTEISKVLADMDREVDGFIGSVEQIAERWSHTREKAERCSLTGVTEASLNYLFELLGLERRLSLARLSHSEGDQSPVNAPEVAISAASSEVSCFLSYLLLLVKTILPRVRDIEVNVDYEQISSGAAALLTGSSPGRYARLTLSHRGQSVTANTISAQSDWLGVLSRYSTDSTECALFLLTRQVRRMGGFISVQSSTSRGTNICIYLPEDIRRATRMMGGNAGAEPGLVGSSTDNIRQALVVSDDRKAAQELSAMMDSLSLEPMVRQAKDLLQEIVTPLSFNGLGFSNDSGQSDGSNASSDDTGDLYQATAAERMNFEPFRLVIFDSCKIDFDVLTLLDELGRENRRMVKVLLLEDEGLATNEVLQRWKVVVKPVDPKYLRELVEKLIHQESPDADDVFAEHQPRS